MDGETPEREPYGWAIEMERGGRWEFWAFRRTDPRLEEPPINGIRSGTGYRAVALCRARTAPAGETGGTDGR